MFIKQLYTTCLAEAAYYIESDNEAVIIDPIRETEPYTELARERNAVIRYVFETHFHADFVSGHIDLASKTGATIVYGPGADTGYKVHNAADGEVFRIGKITLTAIHTPGHTLESTCYLLRDESGKPHCIFTGDTLFVGDVGRPDLLDGVISREELAGKLFDSLHHRLKVLPDEVIVYPAHGPGSACGKNIGKETWSTMGEQKRSNYALLETDKDKFIETVTTGLLPPPAYFFADARINKQGYESLDAVISRNLRPLTADEVETLGSEGTLILDTRIPDEFEKGFVPGALNIGLNGTFAVWAGSLIDINRELILVSEPGREQESILRLARVGIEKVRGYLAGGFESWKKAGKPVDSVESITPEEFASRVTTNRELVLDVRKPSEFEAGHVETALNLSLADLPIQAVKLDNAPYLIHCAGGYRSMIACSMLKAKGFTNVKNVLKGYSGIKETPVRIVVPAEQ
jgi:hydroxyacylglutathione hydrolase